MTHHLDTEALLKTMRRNGNNGAPRMNNGCYADLCDEAADEIERLKALVSPPESEPVAAGPRIKPEIITALRDWAEFEQDGGNVEQGAAIDLILDWYDRQHASPPSQEASEAEVERIAQLTRPLTFSALTMDEHRDLIRAALNAAKTARKI